MRGQEHHTKNQLQGSAPLQQFCYDHCKYGDLHPIRPLHPYLAKDIACHLEKSCLSSSVHPQNENGKLEAITVLTQACIQAWSIAMGFACSMLTLLGRKQ